jgi:hypothetical protein
MSKGVESWQLEEKKARIMYEALSPTGSRCGSVHGGILETV